MYNIVFQDATGQTVVKTHQTPSTSTYYDFLALPNVQYSLGLKIQSAGGMEQDTGISLSVTTPLCKCCLSIPFPITLHNTIRFIMIVHYL